MNMKTDVVVYVWNQTLGHEVVERFTIEGHDEDGKVRAAIGAWISEKIGAPVGYRWDHKLRPQPDENPR